MLEYAFLLPWILGSFFYYYYSGIADNREKMAIIRNNKGFSMLILISQLLILACITLYWRAPTMEAILHSDDDILKGLKNLVEGLFFACLVLACLYTTYFAALIVRTPKEKASDVS